MYRFYHSNSLDLNQIIILDEFAGHHALRVMRIKVNDPLILFNGDGFEYKGQVNGINKKTINVEILSKKQNFIFVEPTFRSNKNINISRIILREIA